jgi:hypothetical protein
MLPSSSVGRFAQVSALHLRCKKAGVRPRKLDADSNVRRNVRSDGECWVAKWIFISHIAARAKRMRGSLHNDPEKLHSLFECNRTPSGRNAPPTYEGVAADMLAAYDGGRSA